VRVLRRGDEEDLVTRIPDVERLRRYWDRHAGSYDRQMQFIERKLFGDSRQWVCRGAAGDVLEVGIGTGLNLGHYPAAGTLTGVDLSPEMLEHARRRAAAGGRPVTLRVGDAHHLEFPDHSFDTVVCTFALCAIPDERRAVAEMWRVLRPGGQLRLADHVVSTSAPVRLLQRLLEVVSIPSGGEHFRRRPLLHLRDLGFTIEQQERFALGIVERVCARKPSPD
jgi:ubiquinone/menaquinone biosynthesis C-methylase UbiE